MPNVRRDVWGLGTGWTDPLLWYARAVGTMESRAITDPTSWLYLAAMHGIDEDLWRQAGYLAPGVALPSGPAVARDWAQCQHHTWYFLPWHRGYLAAFEAIVRAAVVELGGPADWTLPYWNYNETAPAASNTLPAPFREAKMPDGSTNPLFVALRVNDVAIVRGDIDLTQALTDPEFTGPGGGGSPGFGGAETVFAHNGSRKSEGWLEQSPHDIVHGDVGGNDGLMADPDTAALDPIFWLHHANIDRLWEVWLRRDAQHANPTDPAWLNGPLVGRKFYAPGPNGAPHVYTAKDMLDTTAPQLGYIYEDVSDPLGAGSRLSLRLGDLGVGAEATSALLQRQSVPKTPNVELLGANNAAVKLDQSGGETVVKVDKAVTTKLTGSFKGLAAAQPAEPDRIFLNLENIRGENDAAKFYVYVDLPKGANPGKYPQNRVGVVSLFGMRAATRPGGDHGGNGISKVLEITKLVDALHLSGQQLGDLTVRFVAASDLRPDDAISVDRVSVFRQG